MLGKSAIALRELLKWNEMRLEVHKLTETINNHRKPGLLTTRKHWQLGAPPGRSWVWLQAISERTQPPAEPPAVTAPPPSWGLFCICVVCGAVSFVREAWGGRDWDVWGVPPLLGKGQGCAELCRRMWWGDTRWGSAGASAEPRLGSSSAAGQGSCTSQLCGYKAPAWLITAATLPLTPCCNSLFEQHLPEPILTSPACCCTV